MPLQAGISTLVLVAVLATLAVLALSGASKPQTQAELNDGGVWVTNTAGSEFSRFIKSVREQDSPGSVDSSDFDLLQSAGRVLLHDRVKSAIRAVDPATMKVGPQTALPSPNSAVVLGGPIGAEVVAITDPDSGSFWVLPYEQATAMTPSTQPTGTAGPGVVATVDEAGTAWLVNARDSQLLRVEIEGGKPQISSTGIPAELSKGATSGPLAQQVTAVGQRPVILNADTGALWVDGDLVTLSGSQGYRLQAPSSPAGSVLVASRAGLLEVGLDGGALGTVADPVTAASDPPAPVRVGGCGYAAFPESSQTIAVRACPGSQVLARPLLGFDGRPAKPAETSALRWRVNRGLVVLNDEHRGALWDPDDPQPERLDAWDRLAELKTEKQSDQTDDVVAESVCQPAGGPNHKPVAVDDSVGARPGQPVVIDVLANDSDIDCDVIAIADPDGGQGSGLDPADGAVALVAEGRKLQFTPGATAAARTVRVPYTLTDGHRGSTAGGVVKVRVSPVTAANKPPQMLRTASTVVESGRSVTYNVASDFIDPDGDPLFLVAASVDGAKGSVRFSPDGSVVFKDGGQAIGRVAVDLQVSDGRDLGTGKLIVEVRRQGNLAPTARSDYARTRAGEPVAVFPLANDTDPNDDDLRLVSVTDPKVKGMRLRVDKATARVLLTASEPGSYQLDYRVADAADDVLGRIRVDVTARSANSPPVAMVDAAQVKLGQTATVDALFNDFDVDGDVLAVTSAKVDSRARGSIEAVVVSSRMIKLRLLRELAQPATVTYQLSDGEHRTTGTVIVRELREGSADEAPTAVRDTVRVRPGGLATIDVLANDRDPAGDGLSLASELVSEPKSGQAHVNGTAIRFAAGAETGRFPFDYRITDSLGNRAIGRVTVQVVADAENNPPIAPSVTARVAQDGTVRIRLPLAGADPDGDPVVLRSVAGSDFGNEASIVAGSASSIDYRASSPQVGTDRVQYQICDVAPASRCTDGSIRVGVIAQSSNSAPVTLPDRVKVRPGRRVGVAVLANDSDSDGDQLSLDQSGLRPPAGLEVTQLGNLVVFTAPAAGDFSITYAATDGKHPPVSGHLAVEISDQAPLLAPVATDDAIDPSTLAKGQRSTNIAVLANDVDPDGTPDQLQVQIPATATGAVVRADGTVDVDLGSEPRVVEYEVVDPDQRRGYGFILIPSVAGFAPKAIKPLPDFEVAAGKELRIGLDQLVVDPDNGPSQLRILADGTSVEPASEVALVSGPAQLTYQPPADSVTDHAVIKVAVTDGEYVRTIQVPVTITIPNRPPVVTEIREDVELAAAQPLVLDLSQSVKDPDTIDRGKAAKFSDLQSAGSNGVSATLKADGTFTVAAGSATAGDTATYTFQVEDPRGATAQGTVIITVVPTKKDPPSTAPDTIDRLDAGGTATRNVVANDFDPFTGEPDAGLRLTDVAVVSGGITAQPAGGDSVRVTANAGFAGLARVSYTVQDHANRQADGLLEVYVWGTPSAPGAPTEVEGRSSATSVTLEWAAATANAFSDDPDARSVTYEIGYGGTTQECLDTTCRIEGLTPGKAYTFTATAVNDVGRSKPSPTSAAIVPDALPSAPVFRPVSGRAAYDDGSVSLVWTQPSYEGSRLTGYELQISPGGRVEKLSAAANTTVVTGLTNGTEYQFTLSAINAKGATPGEPYTQTPTALPGTPASVRATGTEGPEGKTIEVSWERAASGGDDSMTYEVVLYQGDTVVDRRTDVTGTSVSLVGENGRTYRVGVTATNRKGSGSQAMSKSVTPIGAPGAVTGLRATATGADGEVDLEFTAPANTGGVAEADLAYELDLGEGWGPLRGRKLTGLTNGRSYTIRVRANNGKVGADASTNATPYGPVPKPEVTSEKPSAKQVTFTWSAAANGLPITVTTTVDSGSANKAEPTGSLTLGTAYDQSFTIVVEACDSMNHCARTTRTATTDPLPPPVPVPTISTEKPSATQIRFNWNAASSGLPITVKLQVDGGGWENVDTSGSRTVGTGYSQDHSATVESCDTEGRCEHASASARTDAEPPPPAAIRLSKGAPKQTSFCSDPSCAFVVVELVNFPTNQCFNFDLDSDHGPFAAPRQVCTNGSGYGVSNNWWVYGYPGTNVYANVNGVSAPPLRW